MLQTIRTGVTAQRGRARQLRQMLRTSTDKHEIARLTDQETALNREALIAILTGTTAVIHIYLGSTLFVLNGAGYLALLAAHYAVPQRESYKQWTRDALYGYTGFTLVGYFVVKGVAGWTNPIGVATKLVELGLLHVLQADRKAADEAPVLLLQSEEATLEMQLIDNG